MARRCYANGCDEKTAPTKLMCLRHWRMVSSRTQRAVWSAFKAHGVGRQWLLAAKAAREEVAAREATLLRELDADLKHLERTNPDVRRAAESYEQMKLELGRGKDVPNG